jgi:hypothetical protein
MYIKCSTEKQNFLTWYEKDFYHIKEITGATNFQPCEPEEEKNIFTNLFYMLRSKKNIFIHFDFKNEQITIDGKKQFKIIVNHEFTFKKTRGNNILAANGIKGFYSFVLESMNTEKSAFSSYTFGVLENLSK